MTNWRYTDPTETVVARDIDGGGTESMLASKLPEGIVALPYVAPPEPVPQQITRAQGKAALIMSGKWPAVLAYVDSIQDPTEKALANVALHDTLNWERTSPTVLQAAAALGMTSAELDQLFVSASKVVL